MLIIDPACAPTEALDLRADALAAADDALLVVLDKLCYLSDLATVCRRFGYPLPYGGSDLRAAMDDIRELAGRVRAEQGG